MAAGHPWSVVFQFLFHVFFFLPLLRLVAAWRRFLSLVVGAGSVNDGVVARGLRDAVEVRRVLWRHDLRRSLGDGMDNVFHVHARYEDAREFAWNDPRVHLFHLSEEGATFVRTKKGVKVYDSNVNPFCFFSIYDHAEEFGVVPLETFVRLAEERLQDLNASASPRRKKVVFVFSLPRSGSTAILQRFESFPNSLAISEPQPFAHVPVLTLRRDSRANLFPFVLLFVVKSLFIEPKSVDLVAVKLVNSPWLLKDALDAFPALPFDARFLYTHRRPRPTLDSILRVSTEQRSGALGFGHALPIIGRRLFSDDHGLRLGVSVRRLVVAGLRRVVDDEVEWRRRFEGWTSALRLEEMDKALETRIGERAAEVGRISTTALFYLWFLPAALTVRELRRRKEYNEKIMTIRFEEFVTASEETVERMMGFCGIDSGLTGVEPEGSTAAAAADSQRRSVYSRVRITRHATRLTEEDVAQVDANLKAAGLAGGFDEFEDP